MLARVFLLSGLLAFTATAHAHGEQPHSRSNPSVTEEQKEWGIAGHDKDITRTVTFRMSDRMRFDPEHLAVTLGETLELVVINEGLIMHEFVIGTRAENEEHALLMKKFPDMEHDEPYMAHVAPGETQRIVWHFNRRGAFEFACLIAGHYDAGMKGTISVTPPQGVGGLDENSIR